MTAEIINAIGTDLMLLNRLNSIVADVVRDVPSYKDCPDCDYGEAEVLCENHEQCPVCGGIDYCTPDCP